MANKKITELTEETSPVGADLLPLVDDVSGTPTTKKVTVTNLMTLAPVQSADISGLATQVSLGNHEALTSSVHGISAFGATLVADADASTARTTLGLGTAAAKNVGTSNGNVVELDATGLPAVDGSQLLNLPSPDVNTPLNTALRGTDNPHIGAYPNQSFKVVDNPYKSVMVVADEAGNLKLLNSLGVNNIAVGFSVVEDGVEPDIEVVSGSETYSVISGDSDSKGANGLPTRQGFNLPDIGANPAPILISGGLIA